MPTTTSPTSSTLPARFGARSDPAAFFHQRLCRAGSFSVFPGSAGGNPDRAAPASGPVSPAGQLRRAVRSSALAAHDAGSPVGPLPPARQVARQRFLAGSLAQDPQLALPPRNSAPGRRPCKDHVVLPAPHDVSAADPSEAVRSHEIVPILTQHLEIIEFRPLGEIFSTSSWMGSPTISARIIRLPRPGCARSLPLKTPCSPKGPSRAIGR